MTARFGNQTYPLLQVDFYCQDHKLYRIAITPDSKFSYTVYGSCWSQKIIAHWLGNYLQGTHLPPPLPLDFSRFRPFTKCVLEQLYQIPFGQTATYQQIAQSAGSIQAYRAVGTICHRNPYPMMVPCHRVIKSDGSLGGFALGKALKQELLTFEQQSRFFAGKDFLYATPLSKKQPL